MHVSRSFAWHCVPLLFCLLNGIRILCVWCFIKHACLSLFLSWPIVSDCYLFLKDVDSRFNERQRVACASRGSVYAGVWMYLQFASSIIVSVASPVSSCVCAFVFRVSRSFSHLRFRFYRWSPTLFWRMLRNSQSKSAIRQALCSINAFQNDSTFWVLLEAINVSRVQLAESTRNSVPGSSSSAEYVVDLLSYTSCRFVVISADLDRIFARS